MRLTTLQGQDDERMMPPLKQGARLPRPDWPGIETERLILRQWRESDIAANTAMLGDPLSGRFITADRKPVTDPMAGWRNAAIMAGHWVLHGFGMFAVEEKSSGQFVGRVGPFCPPIWPGFEIGWGIAKECRGKGYAVEAARASIDWTFASFELKKVVHCIDRENTASQAVARRLGASNKGETVLFGHSVDLWVTHRSKWAGGN
jgi:RimJ/RimL family protein N-acetyltransferase